jgi:ribosome-associated protein
LKKFPLLVSKIIESLEDIKGVDIVVLDIRELASYTDYLVICSGTSTTHVGALVDSIEEKTKREKPTYISRSPDDSWRVVDFIDVVVHVFQDEVRKFYDLESLWGDAKKTKI